MKCSADVKDVLAHMYKICANCPRIIFVWGTIFYVTVLLGEIEEIMWLSILGRACSLLSLPDE